MTNISITTDDTLEVTYSVSSDTGSLDEILNIKKNNTEQNLTNVNVKNVKKFTWSPTSEHKNKTYKFTHTGDSEDLIVEVSANIIDNFEYSPQGLYDNTEDIFNYWTVTGGNSNIFSRVQDNVHKDSYSLFVDATTTDDTTSTLSTNAGDGLSYYPQRGQVFSFWYYINVTSSDGRGPRNRTYFGWDNKSNIGDSYNILHWYQENTIRLYGDGHYASGTLPAENMWTLYVIDYDSNNDGTITLAYYDDQLNLIDQISISDTSYSGSGLSVNNSHDETNPLTGEIWYDEIKRGDQGSGYIQ
jgi:hypothetical protein